jgi:hypothetical protein
LRAQSTLPLDAGLLAFRSFELLPPSRVLSPEILDRV